jgi:hypothetical protein
VGGGKPQKKREKEGEGGSLAKLGGPHKTRFYNQPESSSGDLIHYSLTTSDQTLPSFDTRALC